MKKYQKIFAASIVAASTLLSGCLGLEFPDLDELFSDQTLSGQPGYSKIESPFEITTGAGDSTFETSKTKLDGTSTGTVLSFDEINGVTISRLYKESGEFKGEKGVWTVFVYMCASDLESKQASATNDLIEMQNATKNCSNLRFVIQADGTTKWHNDLCQSNKMQRIIIENGSAKTVDSKSSANMGKAGTLRDFIAWGLENYPSEHMALDFWNHGGGSITGVCFDQKYSMDSLSLAEIDDALAKVFDKMPRKFDLIGFDACLMGTIETANILVPYAEYMLASQNLESGNGWDYTSFANAVKSGAESGADVGRSLADGYYNACIKTGENVNATQAVIDLSKVDNFIKAFDLYAKDAYEYAADHLNEVIKAAKSSDNFGGNNRTEGYTNMVDIADLLYNSSFAKNSASSALNALNSCVIYKKNGNNKRDSGGLSLYYPLSVRGSREIDIFKSLCVSPYYLNLVDLCAYGSSTNGYTSNYDYGSLLAAFANFWLGGSSQSGNFNYWNQEQDTSLNFDQNKSSLEYEVKPHLNEDGYYAFKLTEDSLENLDTVYCNIMQSFWDDEDGKEYMLDLGTDDYVDLDWDTGWCYDAFDGLWVALPDGQPLCAYLIEQNEDNGVYSNVYTCPIYLNDEYTNLKMVQTFKSSGTVVEILGTWDGVDEYGAAAKQVYQLKNGDVIEPCYYAYDPETFEYVRDYYGYKYIYNSRDTFGLNYLEDADYYYAFEIYDFYDNALYTDFVLFGFEDGEIYYYD